MVQLVKKEGSQSNSGVCNGEASYIGVIGNKVYKGSVLPIAIKLRSIYNLLIINHRQFLKPTITMNMGLSCIRCHQLLVANACSDDTC